MPSRTPVENDGNDRFRLAGDQPGGPTRDYGGPFSGQAEEPPERILPSGAPQPIGGQPPSYNANTFGGVAYSNRPGTQPYPYVPTDDLNRAQSEADWPTAPYDNSAATRRHDSAPAAQGYGTPTNITGGYTTTSPARMTPSPPGYTPDADPARVASATRDYQPRQPDRRHRSDPSTQQSSARTGSSSNGAGRQARRSR